MGGVAQRLVLDPEPDQLISRGGQLVAQQVLRRLPHASRLAGEELLTHDRAPAFLLWAWPSFGESRSPS